MPDRSPYTVKSLLLYLADLERQKRTVDNLPEGGGDLSEDPGLKMSARLVVSHRKLREWPDVQRIMLDCEAAGYTFDAAGMNQWVAFLCKVHHKLPNEVAEWGLDQLCDLAARDVTPAAGQIKFAEPAGDSLSQTKAKRSTERGEGQVKLIAALTKHHKYADGSCLNQEPIGNNELARMADVSPSTASIFFKEKFNGHTAYRRVCASDTRLVTSLKLLNIEFAPHILYGAKPPGEDERDDE
jgi:hypothetical protein